MYQHHFNHRVVLCLKLNDFGWYQRPKKPASCWYHACFCALSNSILKVGFLPIHFEGNYSTCQTKSHEAIGIANTTDELQCFFSIPIEGIPLRMVFQEFFGFCRDVISGPQRYPQNHRNQEYATSMAGLLTVQPPKKKDKSACVRDFFGINIVTILYPTNFVK